MKRSGKTITFRFERSIPAPPRVVYAAWLNPGIPGTPWNAADQLILDPTENGLFYLLHGDYAHYGRFATAEPPRRIRHTWMSPNTSGEDSTVTVTFRRRGAGTLMTLQHSGLPDNALGKLHREGWSNYLRLFPEHFSQPARSAARALEKGRSWQR